MSFEMSSVASGLMRMSNLYHNQQGMLSKWKAQVGYGVTLGVAAVESCSAAMCSILSLPLYPYSSKPFEHTAKWLNSSAFCFGWSAVNSVNNFRQQEREFIVDEASVRQMLSDEFVRPTSQEERTRFNQVLGATMGVFYGVSLSLSMVQKSNLSENGYMISMTLVYAVTLSAAVVGWKSGPFFFERFLRND